MFYYGSIFVTNADAPNLVGDFMRNRWAVVHGLQEDVNHYSDTETKMTLQFESPEDFPFELIHALNTVSTVDFRWADEGQGSSGPGVTVSAWTCLWTTMMRGMTQRVIPPGLTG